MLYLTGKSPDGAELSDNLNSGDFDDPDKKGSDQGTLSHLPPKQRELFLRIQHNAAQESQGQKTESEDESQEKENIPKDPEDTESSVKPKEKKGVYDVCGLYCCVVNKMNKHFFLHALF